MKNRIKHARGVTLIELLVVLAVVAILSGITLPALGSMFAGNDLNTSQENLIAALNKARGMSISRGTITTVTINAATHSVQLSAADNSFSDTVQVRPSVNIGANATLTFGAQGTATAAAIILSAVNYASLPPRTINVSPTGIVTAGR